MHLELLIRVKLGNALLIFRQRTRHTIAFGEFDGRDMEVFDSGDVDVTDRTALEESMRSSVRTQIKSRKQTNVLEKRSQLLLGHTLREIADEDGGVFSVTVAGGQDRAHSIQTTDIPFERRRGVLYDNGQDEKVSVTEERMSHRFWVSCSNWADPLPSSVSSCSPPLSGSDPPAWPYPPLRQSIVGDAPEPAQSERER